MTTTTTADIISSRYPHAGPLTISYVATYPCPELNPPSARVKGLFSWYPGAWHDTDARPCDDLECPLHEVTIDELTEDEGRFFLPGEHVPPGYVRCEFPVGDAHAVRQDLIQETPTVWHEYAGTAVCRRPHLCPECYSASVYEDDTSEETCAICR